MMKKKLALIILSNLAFVAAVGTVFASDNDHDKIHGNYAYVYTSAYDAVSGCYNYGNLSVSQQGFPKKNSQTILYYDVDYWCPLTYGYQYGSGIIPSADLRLVNNKLELNTNISTNPGFYHYETSPLVTPTVTATFSATSTYGDYHYSSSSTSKIDGYSYKSTFKDDFSRAGAIFSIGGAPSKLVEGKSRAATLGVRTVLTLVQSH